MEQQEVKKCPYFVPESLTPDGEFSCIKKLFGLATYMGDCFFCKED